jgi:hypothetical protein
MSRLFLSPWLEKKAGKNNSIQYMKPSPYPLPEFSGRGLYSLIFLLCPFNFIKIFLISSSHPTGGED